MSGKIYLVGADGDLHTMNEAPYEAETLLQRLLADYPDLLAGDQMRPNSPRRWLLISREVSVPDSESERARWSVDHLFIDQDGIPTLVEVKRSSNTQVRREVVGQMLDYAANGTVYWSLEQITASFVSRCESEGLDPSDVIELFLDEGGDLDEESFWQTVKTNLQAGRVRLVFVADAIPPELRRIIEFLNDQMDPAEVVGVEVPQFVGDGRQALVPRVVGVTAESERRKSVSASKRRRWDEASFLEELSQATGPAEVDAFRQLRLWAKDRSLESRWGSGIKTGSWSPKCELQGESVHLFTVYTDYNIQLPFASMRVPPFNRFEMRRELADRLEQISQEIELADSKLDGWPFTGKGVVVGNHVVASFLDVWDWYLGEVNGQSGSDG